MQSRERIIAELQMLTNVVTNDIDYLIYLLLEEGTHFSSSGEDKYVQNSTQLFQNQVEDLEKWFSNLNILKEV